MCIIHCRKKHRCAYSLRLVCVPTMKCAFPVAIQLSNKQLQTRHFVFSNTNFLGNQLVHYFSRAMFTNFRKRSNSVRTKRQQKLMAILRLGLLLMSVQFWVDRNSFHHRLSVCFLRLYTRLVFVQIWGVEGGSWDDQHKRGQVVWMVELLHSTKLIPRRSLAVLSILASLMWNLLRSSSVSSAVVPVIREDTIFKTRSSTNSWLVRIGCANVNKVMWQNPQWKLESWYHKFSSLKLFIGQKPYWLKFWTCCEANTLVYKFKTWDCLFRVSRCQTNVSDSRHVVC